MSIWTHITGAIRVDSLGKKIPEIGKTCDFDSSEQEWKDCDVPIGSEGSLQIKYVDNSRDEDSGNFSSHSLSRGSFVLWGDLRDFDEEKIPTIEKWIKGIAPKLKEYGTWIRQGVIHVHLEYPEKRFTYIFDDEWKLL